MNNWEDSTEYTMSSEGLHQDDSEYIRAAVREKLEKDSGLTPAEEDELFKRIEEVEEGQVETVPLEEPE